MKTDAPGPWRCETYLKCWIFGIRDGLVRDHIDNCRFCKPIVYGDGKLFMTSLDEDIAQRVAERKARTRRRFLKGVAAAGILGVLGLWSLNFADARRSVSSTIDSVLERENLELDALLQRRGRLGIENRLGANEQDGIRVLRWIVDRRHLGMLDLVFSSLMDVRIEVRQTALEQLWLVAPADAAPHLGALSAAIAAETDDDRRMIMERLEGYFENG